jgi:sec-independent protein translocase protein TatA
MLSPVELGIVGLIVVLLFGTKKLPELGSGLGKAISNFKRSYKESTEIDVTPAAARDAQSDSVKAADSESKS